MKKLIAHRPATRWTNLFSILSAFTFLVVWLPLVRSTFDGSSYMWGTSYFGVQLGGAGITADYVFLVVQLLFYVALWHSAFWTTKRALFYLLLIVWFFNFFGNLLADIVINGDTEFHGDTLNIHVSLTWIIVPLSVLALLLIIKMIIADVKSAAVSIAWKPRNSKRFWLIAGLLPVQAVLLATGEPHGFTDQVGVVITIAQCFFIPAIFKPHP